MAEEDDVIIKVIDTKKISVDLIDLSHFEARTDNVTKNLKRFAERIRKMGLIQPIVVYPKGERHELLDGQRRFLAHKDELKWSKILAMIIEEPEKDMIKRTISWLANEARLQMTTKDKMRHIVHMYSEGWKIPDIAEDLVMKQTEVSAMIKLPRVPDVVRLAVEGGEIDADAAVRATDAKKFVKGVTSEDKGSDVLDLAKKMTSLTKTQRKNVANTGQETDGETDNDTLIDEGVNRTTEGLKVDLDSSEMQRLATYSDGKNKTKGEAAAELIVQGLDASGD